MSKQAERVRRVNAKRPKPATVFTVPPDRQAAAERVFSAWLDALLAAGPKGVA